MSNLDIGLSGLDAARKGLDIIGNNIANAATEGYHRQTIELVPLYSCQNGGTLLGGGVDISGVNSVINNFIEQEILKQQSSLCQVSQEASTLKSIETSLGELGSGSGLSVAIDNFFNSLNSLSAHPDEAAYQNQVLSSGDTMAGQFRTLGDFLNNLESQIKMQADNVVGQINSLSGQIANLNETIQRTEMNGGQANNLCDQRDELIKKMSELASVETQQREYGVVDVSVSGNPVVMGTATMELKVGLQGESQLGIAPAGAYAYQTAVDGGQLGGLLALYNGDVHDIHSKLDTLAASIMQQVNQYHVQGVGTDGSFTDLSSNIMSSQNISDFVPPVSDGAFFVCVTYTNPVSHDVIVTRDRITVNTTDTLNSIAAKLSAIPQLNAFVSGTRLTIQAENDCKFDFSPVPLPTPTRACYTAIDYPPVSISGVYTGTENQTFTCIAEGSGSVGNGTLKLNVRDGAGNTIGTLNIGSGYAAGDKLDLGNGIKIAVGSGDLNNGDNFAVDAYANTDTSGLLAAIGMNTFFSGSNASNMAISNSVADSPGRIAASLGAGLADNTNARRMASISNTKIDGLNSTTISQFYRKLVTDIGQKVSTKQTMQTNSEDMMLSLTNQQTDISGVDINEEAAQMIVFQQMFQASAKYLSVIQNNIATLMNLWGVT
jgi:flagellar hook-associated protein 1 FlgK